MPCFECGGPEENLHHVVPAALGGTKTVWLCLECHSKAHGEKGFRTRSTLQKEAMSRIKSTYGRMPGNIPYGCSVAGQFLVAKASEIKVIQIMAQLREKGKSLREIASYLDSNGIPTKTGEGKWQAYVIQRICHRQKTGWYDSLPKSEGA